MPEKPDSRRRRNSDQALSTQPSAPGRSAPFDGPVGDLTAPPSYMALSKSLPASILFITPLLLVYEFGILAIGADTNAMVGVAKGPLFVFGRRATLVFNVVVIAVLLFALTRLIKRRALRWTVFLVMLVESALYALLLAPLAYLAVSGRLSLPEPRIAGDVWRQVVAAAGAGVYEELLFRGFLLASLCWIGRNVLKAPSWITMGTALGISAALFSVWHVIEPTESANWAAFRFRFAAGILLGSLFLWRGLGVAACTHAIYNAFCRG